MSKLDPSASLQPRHGRVLHPGAPSSHTPVPSCNCPDSSSVGCPKGGGMLCPWSLEQSSCTVSVPTVLTGQLCPPRAVAFIQSASSSQGSRPLPRHWTGTPVAQPGSRPSHRAPASHLTSGAGVCPHGLNFREWGHYLQHGIMLRPNLTLRGCFYSRMFSPQE